MLKKIMIVVAVCSIGFNASGCSEYINRALAYVQVAGEVLKMGQDALVKVKDTIAEGCSAIGQFEVEAEQAASSLAQCRSFHTAVVRTRAGFAAVCNNLPLLTDAEAGNYVSKIGSELKNISKIRPAGC